jgi:hypothetical protein
MITLALPTYSSNRILWLQLESLCNQKTQYPWELILCEEVSAGYSGEIYVSFYEERLKEAGCVNIKFLHTPGNHWVPLSRKWVEIAKEAQFENFMLCASDNYSAPDRIERTVQKHIEGYDWVHWQQGIFYSIPDQKHALYKLPSELRTGLYMSTKTSYIKDLDEKATTWPSSGIDQWIRDHSSIHSPYLFEERPDGIHTDGFNQISGHRKFRYNNRHFNKVREPFHPDRGRWERAVPKYISDMIKDVFSAKPKPLGSPWPPRFIPE